MSDTKLKEQLKTYSKEKLINILIDFVNVCHEQEDIINKATEYIKSKCIFSDTWEEIEPNKFVPIGNITYKQLSSKKVKELIDIFKGVDKE